MAKYRQGFLPYGTDDEDIVLQDTLTQAEGVEVSYSSDQAGTPDITSDGFDKNGGRARLYDLAVGAVANWQNLFHQGSLSFEVDTDFIKQDHSPSANSYIMSRTQGWIFKGTAGYITGYFLAQTGTGQIKVNSIGKPIKTRIEIHWRQGKFDFIVDGLRVSRGQIGNHASGVTNFQKWYLGGLTTATSGDSGFKVKNFQLSFRPQQFPISPEYGSIGFIGTSYVTQGSFPKWVNPVAGETWPEDPGYGFIQPDTANPNGGEFNDVGALPTFVRQLSKQGIWTNHNKNYGHAGASLHSGAISTKQTEMFADGGFRPKVIYSDSGTNDAANLSAVIADFETNYKAMLTEANGKGVKHYVLCTIPSLRNDPTYQTDAYDAHLAVLNAIIQSLPAWSIAQGHDMQVHLSDNFNNFGGHDLDPADWKTAPNIHPNDQGSYKIGKWMAEALL